MKAYLTAAAFAVASLAMPATAQSVDRTRTVQIGDLDLSRSDGVAALDRRLTDAIRRTCADPAQVGTDKYAVARRCRIETARAFAPQRDAVVAQARGVALAGR